jgi:hypothetical protein
MNGTREGENDFCSHKNASCVNRSHTNIYIGKVE